MVKYTHARQSIRLFSIRVTFFYMPQLKAYFN